MISKFIFIYLFQFLMIHAADHKIFDKSMAKNKIQENNTHFLSDNSSSLDCLPIGKNSLKIVKTNNGIFMLNGTQLNVLSVSSSSNNRSTLTSLRTINQINNGQIIDFHGTFWHGNILLVIAIENRYQVYIEKQSDEQEQSVHLIEKIPMYGHHKKVVLFPDRDNLYCLIESTFMGQENGSMLRLFKWSDSIFSLLEMKMFQDVEELAHCQTDQQTLIVFTRKIEGRILVQVYIFEDDRIRYTQNLHLAAIGTHVYEFGGQCYLLENQRTSLEPAASYIWKRNQFQKFKQNNGLFNISKLVSNRNLIVARDENSVTAYSNALFTAKHDLPYSMVDLFDFQCIGTRVVLFRRNSNGCLKIDVIEVQLEQSLKEMLPNSQSNNEKCLMEVQYKFRELQPVIKLGTQKISAFIPRNYSMKHIVHIMTTKSIILEKGTIKRIQIDATLRITATKLLHEIHEIKQRIEHFKLLHTRTKRETSVPAIKRIKTMIVKNLKTTSGIFNDAALMKSNIMHFKSKIVAESLHANRLALTKSDAAAQLKSSAIATDAHLKVDHVHFVKKLTVRTINGIDWDHFVKSIYLKHLQTTIIGDLILKHSLVVNHLEADTVNGWPINQFVTLNTDQTIESDIFITKFFAVNVQANKVNDIDFKRDLVTVTANTIINTPVKIAKCYVSGNLTLSEDETMTARHIVGTGLEDLSQVYNGKVVIKGSLKLNRLLLDRPKTAIFSKLGLFDLNVADQYWMKSVDQVFEHPVTFASILKMPQIHSDFINNHPATEYQTIDQNPSHGHMNLIIQSAYVRGNVYPAPETQSKLSQISKTNIRRNSNATVIGRKQFVGDLVVDTFVCPTMDKLSANLFRKKKVQSELQFFSTKQFTQIRVTGNVIANGRNIDVLALNEHNLFDLGRNWVKLNEAFVFDEITFNSAVHATGISSQTIDRTGVPDLIRMIEQSVGLNGSLQEIRINGNVHFAADLFVTTINGIHLDEYLNKMITTQQGGQIAGTISFADDISVKRLYTRRLQSIDVIEWFVNALQVQPDQTITGEWSFESVHAGTVWASTVNGIATNQLIDVTSKDIRIKSDVTAKSIRIDGSLYGRTLCPITDIFEAINVIPSKRTNWPSITVHGNVLWSDDDPTASITSLLLYAMRNNSDQVISGAVHARGSMTVDQLWCKQPINGIDLRNIYTDALTTTGQFQMITGAKQFSNGLSIENVITEHDVQVPIINNVDIVQLNGTIFRLGDRNIMSGKKTFVVDPLIGQLWTKYTINGVSPNDIVHVNSIILLPPVSFHQRVTIHNNLEFTDSCNKFSFDFFLKNRVRIAGQLQEIHNVITFKNLVCNGTVLVPSINDIAPANIVVRDSNEMQEIIGEKRIRGNLKLAGPAAISVVNRRTLTAAYMNSLALDRIESVRRLEAFARVTLGNGIHIVSNFNDVGIQAVLSWNPPTEAAVLLMSGRTKTMASEAKALHSRTSSSTAKRRVVMYLDFEPSIEIVKDHHSLRPITFVVASTESGEKCDLPHRCRCPFQYGVHITPAHRIYINRRAFFGRTIKLTGNRCNVTVETAFASPCDRKQLAEKRTSTKLQWTSGPNAFGYLTLDTPILNAQLIEWDSGWPILLVLFPNGTITMFELNQQHWHRLNAIHGPWNNDIKVLSWHQHRILVVLTNTTAVNLHGSAHLYHLQNKQFAPLQLIAGDYDLCEGALVDGSSTHMMVLGKVGTNVVSIFRAEVQQKQFRRYNFYQKLMFKSAIKSFVAFSVEDYTYIATVTSSGYFYLHHFNQIEGWVSATHGYFKNIETIVPFGFSNKTYLFVSATDTATIMSYYHQIVYD